MVSSFLSSVGQRFWLCKIFQPLLDICGSNLSPRRMEMKPLARRKGEEELLLSHPNGALCYHTVGLLVVPRVSKSRMEGRPFSF